MTCSNSTEPPGVLLDHTDPLDLAAKAGLRQGDIVIGVNGCDIVQHQALVEAINAATGAESGSASRFLEIEYLPAASVAGFVAAALARKPPQKSLAVAYGLACIAPPLGLHHFYLGRDAHAL